MMDDDDFGEFNEGIPKEESMERSQKIDEFIRTLPDYSILL